MRPVLAKMCSYESAVNGVLDLADFARMNDALDVFEANKALAEKKA